MFCGVWLFLVVFLLGCLRNCYLKSGVKTVLIEGGCAECGVRVGYGGLSGFGFFSRLW